MIPATVVLGTRPEAIKLAPLILAMRSDQRFSVRVISTGQHREMLRQALDLFDIVPDVELDVFEPGQAITDIAAKAIARLGEALRSGDWGPVVVQGDTTTTFAGAFAAFSVQLPVVHVEAGLRTSTIHSPFPEEANRRLTTQLAALHLAPTQQAMASLLDEKVPQCDVVVTGNTGIDALHHVIGLRLPWSTPELVQLDSDPRRVVLVTAHRRENWGPGIEGVAEALARLARSRPDIRIVFPVHGNPRVRQPVDAALKAEPNVLVVDPVPYGDLARLLERCSLVLTDSGGIQEEAPSLGKPVLVLRESTERPEGISAGVARLVGTDPSVIVGEAMHLLDDDEHYSTMSKATSPYGDGHACSRCLGEISARWPGNG